MATNYSVHVNYPFTHQAVLLDLSFWKWSGEHFPAFNVQDALLEKMHMWHGNIS